MAVTVDWPNRIINVPRADMLLVQSVPTEIRELQLNSFRLDLKSLEDDVEGMPFPDTHRHNTIVTLGGVTYARLIEIVNGYTVTFEDGQYAVNLVGANSNVGDVINVNQVSVRSANSAGLTYSKEIEDQAFRDGRVYINPTNGKIGTQYPRGTTNDPTQLWTDAEAIVAIRQLAPRYALRGALPAFSVGDDLSDTDWYGSTPTHDSIDLGGANVNHALFTGLDVTGLCNGGIDVQHGVLNDITGFIGDAVQCGFNGTIILPTGVSSSTYTFTFCHSNVPGPGTPILNCNDATNLNIQFRAYTGGIYIENYSSADNAMSVDLLSGHVILDATCTEGVIVVRGSGHLTDNSGPNCQVIVQGLVTTVDLLTTKKFIALK